MTTWHPLSVKVGTNFANNRLSHGRHSSLADSGNGISYYHINISTICPEGCIRMELLQLFFARFRKHLIECIVPFDSSFPCIYVRFTC
jgi:hypothetical protein